MTGSAESSGSSAAPPGGLGRVRLALSCVVPAVAVVVAYQSRQPLETAWHLIGRAALFWLVPAALAIGGVYFFRGSAYGVPLRVLGYPFTRPFLFTIALVATSLHQLIPSGGLSGYAFLTYALHERDVPHGQASLIALVDTLSYAVAVATLVVAGVVQLAVSGALHPEYLAVAFVPGAALLALGAVLFRLQQDRRRFVPLVLRAKDAVASLLRQRWPDRPLGEILDQYYEGKAMIRGHPALLWRMIGLQYLAICCDGAALYAAFLALGLFPAVWVVVMGFAVSMAGLAVSSVPGGGGSFEVILSLFLAAHGLPAADAIAATLLYRVVAFWLPVTTSGALLWRMRRRRGAAGPAVARGSTGGAGTPPSGWRSRSSGPRA